MVAGVRFFEMSFCDYARAEASVTPNNNAAEAESLINRDADWVWESVGSDDTDTVTITVDFGRSRAFDTLILTLCNLKGFSLSYRASGGSWTTILTETANAAETYFARFAEVTAQEVRLAMTTTQTPDAQKTLRDLILTRQIGQLVGYPAVKITDAEKPSKKEMITGKARYVQDPARAEVSIQFRDHVGAADRDLVDALRRWREEFLVWPCGGNEAQFAHADIGWRLEDIFLVTRDRGFSHQFTKNLYFSGMTGSLDLVEVA